MSEYEKRDPRELDKAGGFYSKHVQAMTQEDLHHKSDIAAELAYRDLRIQQLQNIINIERQGHVKSQKLFQEIMNLAGQAYT